MHWKKKIWNWSTGHLLLLWKKRRWPSREHFVQTITLWAQTPLLLMENSSILMETATASLHWFAVRSMSSSLQVWIKSLLIQTQQSNEYIQALLRQTQCASASTLPAARPASAKTACPPTASVPTPSSPALTATKDESKSCSSEKFWASKIHSPSKSEETL